MVDIPGEVWIRCTLKPGVVYYYENSELVDTEEPHYYVVLSERGAQRIILACATSNIEQIENYISRRHLPLETLVKVSPSSENGLTRESGFNCNTSIFEETESSLVQRHKEKPIKVKGQLEEESLARLILGVKRSPVIEKEIRELL